MKTPTNLTMSGFTMIRAGICGLRLPAGSGPKASSMAQKRSGKPTNQARHAQASNMPVCRFAPCARLTPIYMVRCDRRRISQGGLWGTTVSFMTQDGAGWMHRATLCGTALAGFGPACDFTTEFAGCEPAARAAGAIRMLARRLRTQGTGIGRSGPFLRTSTSTQSAACRRCGRFCFWASPGSQCNGTVTTEISVPIRMHGRAGSIGPADFFPDYAAARAPLGRQPGN